MFFLRLAVSILSLISLIILPTQANIHHENWDSPHLPIDQNLISTFVPSEASRPLAKHQLIFQKNEGQLADDVLFSATAASYRADLIEAGIVIVQPNSADPVTVKLSAHAACTPLPEEPLSSSVNYFIGSDTTHWIRGIKTFQRIRYPSVYPRIDLLFYGHQGTVEFDFIVKPGGNPDDIQLTILEADVLEITEEGGLLIFLPSQVTFFLSAPVIYQEDLLRSISIPVSGGFQIENRTFGFWVDFYDPTLTLVIDPFIEFSTYLGGHGYDSSYTAAFDSNDNLYVSGFTGSVDFPTTKNTINTYHGGSYDVFVTKFDPNGKMLWSTYLGGSDTDYYPGIATNGDAVVVSGTTFSLDFPTLNAHQSNLYGVADAFLTKLNASDGSLLFSTYIGGQDFDSSENVVIDQNQDILVVGQSHNAKSGNFLTNIFPIPHSGSANSDIFLFLLNYDGAYQQSTYFGGFGDDTPKTASLRSNGDIMIAGVTWSADFPLLSPLSGIGLNGAYDLSKFQGIAEGFITVIASTSWNLKFSTFFGGIGIAEINDIQEDSSQNIVFVGSALGSTNIPMTGFSPFRGGMIVETTPNVWAGFLGKINPAFQLTYSTYLDGSKNELLYGLTIDQNDNILVCGSSDSSNYDRHLPIQGQLRGTQDGVISKFNPTLSGLITSTYFGGDGVDVIIDCVYSPSQRLAIVGSTTSDDWPVVAAVIAKAPNTDNGFVTVFYHECVSDNECTNGVCMDLGCQCITQGWDDFCQKTICPVPNFCHGHGGCIVNPKNNNLKKMEGLQEQRK